MLKKRAVIVTGGTLGDWVSPLIDQNDILIGCDRGALFLLEHGFVPDISLGDFDSVSDEERRRIRKESKHYIDCDPIHKDMSDTALALDWAISKAVQEILILGATGTRLDHSLANIYLLKKSLDSRIPCKIIDANNEIVLIQAISKIKKGNYPYISLLPFGGQVTGITLTGFQYSLNHATLSLGESLGISNVLQQDEGTIELEHGYLLVIQSTD